MGVCLDAWADWKDSSVSRWGVCSSPRSRDAREECALFKLGSTGLLPSAGSWRWDTEVKGEEQEDEQSVSRSWASIGKQKVPANRRQDLRRRRRLGGLGKEGSGTESCTAVLLVDLHLTVETRLPQLWVFASLSVERIWTPRSPCGEEIQHTLSRAQSSVCRTLSAASK